ncbi:hypothetical protein CWB41_14010 [Methylovirgula ligni]|nr:hypothetical protein CWB41_14010 [Methylovirgula ligni]
MYAKASDGTPVEFGLLQGVKIDHSFTEKDLYGTNQHRIFGARGTAKFTFSAEVAKISAKLFGELYFGISPVAGQLALQASEAHSVPAETTYTVTATPPGSGTFDADQGVIYAAGANVGQALTPVASSPTAGEYTVNVGTGVYTFAAADASAAVAITYLYTTSSTGQKIAITNEEQGTTPTFSVIVRGRDPDTGLFNTVVANKCSSTKLSMALKQNDWAIPSFDIGAMDDGTGTIATWSFGDDS